MNLYLLRHGIAEARPPAGAAPDAERRLTSKGRRKLCQAAQGMAALGLDFDLVLSSPYVRAWQTAELVAAACHARKHLQKCEALMPGGSAKALIGWLQRYTPRPGEVLLVGHEPYLSQLIALLVAGDSHLTLTLKKGGLCKLAADSLQHGRCASLEWLLTPKQLRLMSGG